MSQNILFEEIAADIKNNDIVLYMKGTKEMPLYGLANHSSALYQGRVYRWL
jgi:glutaredoxin-related protein